MTVHHDRFLQRVLPVHTRPTAATSPKPRIYGTVQPEFAALAPCVPAMPSAECSRCGRHAPLALPELRLIRIDASIIRRAGERCPMATP
jgi:hypothetical protein